MDANAHIKGADAPAHNAAGRSRISLRGWVDILVHVALRIAPSQIGLVAAGVAFYALLAAFPAIAALMALAGLFTDPGAVVDQLSAVAELLPDEAANILLYQAREVAGSSDEGLSLTLWLGVGFAIYVLTRATTSLMAGLNVVFHETEKRGIIAFWATVVGLTVALLFGSVLLLLLLVGLPTLLAFVPLDLFTERMILVLRWVVVALVFVAGMSLLYRWGPSRGRAHWRWLSPGAIVASLLWFLGSMAFATYVANFGNYNETFGSLGGVIILLTWLWLSAFIILLGGLLDAEIEAQTKRDTTAGAVAPTDAPGVIATERSGAARD